MIIAVDFDGTLLINDHPNMALIAKLRQAQRQGDTVILWTCREGERLKQAVLFLCQHGLRPNYVNSNAPEVIKQWGHDSRKVYADVYIDDKSVR